MNEQQNIEEQQAFELLNASDRYQVLKRMDAMPAFQSGEPKHARTVMVLDVETTGLDTARDKIIELGFVVCRYDAGSGALHEVICRYDGFEDPGEPISDVVKTLTGIDDAMVQGQKLDDALINEWLEKSDLIIAHNAGFDRKMVERRFPGAVKNRWACSFKGIDWQAEGIASAKLDYLAYRFGFFFEGHRAVNDAEATLYLLSMNLPTSHQPVMQALLTSARGSYVRLLLGGKVFDQKELLKARRYQWNGDKKIWHTLVPASDQAAELEWLSAEVYAGRKTEVTAVPLTATDMYSIREKV